MRGTLHVLHADDYVRWQRALGAYAHHTKPGWFQRCGLTPHQLDETVAAIGRALGRRLSPMMSWPTRSREWQEPPHLGTYLRQGWRWMLKPAAFHGRLCVAPSVGVNVRFARPDVWLRRATATGLAGGTDRPDPPVSSGVWSRDPNRLFALERSSARARRHDVAIAGACGVTEVSLAGAQAWILSEDVDELVAAQRSGSLRLLPAFDQYVVAASPHVQNLISADIAKTSFDGKAGFPRRCWSTSGLKGSGRYQRNGPLEGFAPRL